MGILTQLGRMLGFRSLENPRRPLDPWSQTLGDSLEGSLSTSGLRVNRDRALTVPAFWRAANLISRTVAKLPMGVYRQVSPGQERDRDHPSDWLLSRCPCEGMTPFVWKQTLTGHVITEGNGYAYIMRRGDGAPVELLPLCPDRTYPVRENGALWYVHELPAGELRRLDPLDMIHLKGYSYDGLEGYSMLAKAKEAVGLGLATQAFGSIFFRNSARPNVVLTHPGRLSVEAKRNLRESWERMFGGLDNAHRTAVLEEGVAAQELSINARDSQLLESRQFSLIDVANLFNLPPSRLGANVSTSYGSLEQENQNLLDDAIDPWLVAWEEECEAKLLTNYQRRRGTHAVSFDRFPLVRADLAQRGAFYQQGLASGWLSPDEVRAREGLNPMPGGVGRTYFFPLNLTPVGVDPDGPGGPAVAPGARLLEVPDLRQEGDHDCGPAAVQGVCQFFGVGPAGRPAYIEALSTSEKAGTRPSAILDLLSRLDLTTTAAGGMEVEDLARCFALGQPVLCPVQAGEDGATVGHWVTVVGTGLGLVFLQDPASGPRMISEEDWLERWWDRDADGVRYDRYGIAVGRMAATIEGDDEGTPTTTGTPTATTPSEPQGELQDTALNGAQITALLAVVEQQSLGILSAAAAKAVMKASFPSVAEALINQICDEVDATPAPTPVDAPPGDGVQGGQGGDSLEANERQARLISSLRALLTDTLARMVRRVGTHARRAAGQPSRFVAWVDVVERDHLDVMTTALGGPLEALGLADPGSGWPEGRRAAAGLLGALRAGLLDLSGRTTASGLSAEVERWCDDVERNPERLDCVRLLLGGE